ncbi:hypothetical protein CY35_05G079700 [Sphagnum magellanicum]|nr:hypothetical protein CY35_05G079700 [Sphagnum magellanicum]
MFDIHLLVSLTTRLGSTEDSFQQQLAWIGKEDWDLMTLQLADERWLREQITSFLKAATADLNFTSLFWTCINWALGKKCRSESDNINSNKLRYCEENPTQSQCGILGPVSETKCEEKLFSSISGSLFRLCQVGFHPCK